MANTYFSFRQFTVEQERTAMKVCTDACLLGAWVAGNVNEAGNVLDIGTGTGLLSLMYAQKNLQSKIDAVEIDSDAASQAQDNIIRSPWASRISVFNTPITSFSSNIKYDLIITNPPFFENDLPSLKEARNKAMHDTSLTLEELKKNINRLISDDGKLVILLPWQRSAYFTDLMQRDGWYLQSSINVRQTPKHGYFRSILGFSGKMTNPAAPEELIIKDALNNYTGKFIELLKDYYLHL